MAMRIQPNSNTQGLSQSEQCISCYLTGISTADSIQVPQINHTNNTDPSPSLRRHHHSTPPNHQSSAPNQTIIHAQTTYIATVNQTHPKTQKIPPRKQTHGSQYTPQTTLQSTNFGPEKAIKFVGKFGYRLDSYVRYRSPSISFAYLPTSNHTICHSLLQK
jgi:hypothetical protein